MRPRDGVVGGVGLGPRYWTSGRGWYTDFGWARAIRPRLWTICWSRLTHGLSGEVLRARVAAQLRERPRRQARRLIVRRAGRAEAAPDRRGALRVADAVPAGRDPGSRGRPREDDRGGHRPLAVLGRAQASHPDHRAVEPASAVAAGAL